MGDVNLDWSSRLKSWTRGDKMRKHLGKHLARAKWPVTCTHPLCHTQYEAQESFSDHLKDDHAISVRVGRSSPQPDLSSKYEFVDCKRHKRKLYDDTSEDLEIDYSNPSNGQETPQTIAPHMLVKNSLDKLNISATPTLEALEQDEPGHSEISQAEDDALFSSFVDIDYFRTPATQLKNTIQDSATAVGVLHDASVPDADNGLSAATGQYKEEVLQIPSLARKPRIILRVKPLSEPSKENQVDRKRLKMTTKCARSNTSRLKSKSLSRKTKSSKSAIPKIRLRLSKH